MLLVTAGTAWVWAHEGHEALPTRVAMTVKGKDGRIIGVVLSREARESLGVISLITARVEEKRIAQRVLAYSVLVTPWQKHAFATSRLAGRIEELRFRAGEVVEAGQALADIKSVELENLQLELLTARKEVRLLAKMLSSSTDLSGSGSVSDQALTEARNEHQHNLDLQEIARGKWTSLGLG